MTTMIFRLGATLALALVTCQPSLYAQTDRNLAGAWSVNVSLRDCQTGATVRNVRSMNLFQLNGSLSEIAVNIMRTPSVGAWTHDHGQVYTATFWFFRYNNDGTFGSMAKVTRSIELSADGQHFTSTGATEDFDANNVLISKVCPVETATRLQ